MSKLPLIARIILGLIFFVFGLNGFLNFIPPPPVMPEKMMAFMNGMMSTGYFMPFLKGMEVLCGLLLLIGAFVPLALVMLAPMTINIFLIHAFLAPEGLIMAVVILVLQAYLAFFAEPYASIVKGIFRCPLKESLMAKKGK